MGSIFKDTCRSNLSYGYFGEELEHSFIKHPLDVLLLCSYVLFTNTLVTGVKMTHGFLSLDKVHCSVLFHLLLFLFFPLLAKGKESAVGNACLHLISLTKFLHRRIVTNE